MSQIAQKAGFRLLDVAEQFESLARPLDLFPYQSRAHFNQRGYALAADATLREVPAPDALKQPP